MFAECCVFIKQSQPPIFATLSAPSVRVHLLGAYLLPKLRYQFAEFLLLSSLKRLRILIRPPVSVCGTVVNELKLSGFSWKQGITHFVCQADLVSPSDLSPADLPVGTTTGLNQHIQQLAELTFSVPIALLIGTGILTCFPSTTHLCLALGADSPYADERCVENLGFRRGAFHPFNATHVSIRTSDTSSIRFTRHLHRPTERFSYHVQ